MDRQQALSHRGGSLQRKGPYLRHEVVPCCLVPGASPSLHRGHDPASVPEPQATAPQPGDVALWLCVDKRDAPRSLRPLFCHNSSEALAGSPGTLSFWTMGTGTPCIRSFIQLSHSFLHSFTPSFVHSFIHSSTSSLLSMSPSSGPSPLPQCPRHSPLLLWPPADPRTPPCRQPLPPLPPATETPQILSTSVLGTPQKPHSQLSVTFPLHHGAAWAGTPAQERETAPGLARQECGYTRGGRTPGASGLGARRARQPAGC